MTRLALLLVGLGLTAATGCAQCDTCDDFPAPCSGPNCGTSGFIPQTQDGLPAGAARMTMPVDDPTPGPNDPNPAASPPMPAASLGN